MGGRVRGRLVGARPANGGLLPDNVGLSGVVGEYLDGKWYGGLYGWTWPHGLYNIASAAMIAAANAVLLTGDQGYLEMPRVMLDRVMELGELRDPRDEPMSLREHWVGQLSALAEGHKTLLTPYRFGDDGPFDYQPMSPIYPAALWNLSLHPADWARLERLRSLSGYDWRRVLAFRTKEDAGHEQPWLRYLAGDNPTYPEEMLRQSYGQICWRLDRVRADDADLTRVSIHHWQELNPLLAEALVQLTLGAPQALYNGGLLHTPLLYLDSARRRPGLPSDVAALVRGLDESAVTVELVNLSPVQDRHVVVQAGAFGEHRFTGVRYSALETPAVYPGEGYAPPDIQSSQRHQPLHDTRLGVHLPPGTRITLRLAMERFVNTPSCRWPDDLDNPAR